MFSLKSKSIIKNHFVWFSQCYMTRVDKGSRLKSKGVCNAARAADACVETISDLSVFR